MGTAVGSSSEQGEMLSNNVLESIKIVIIGNGACGKSSLVDVFVKEQFPTGYTPTLFNSQNKKIELEGKEFNLIIEDTAGQEGYDQMRQLIYPGTQCFVVCFDVSSIPSFTNVENIWLPETIGQCDKVILCGTKGDMRSKVAERVDKKDIHRCVRKNKDRIITYIETSAKENPEGTKLVFEYAARSAKGYDVEETDFGESANCFSGIKKMMNL